MASLKRLYGLREMAVNVPDENAAAFQKVMKSAIKYGHLPADAESWLAGAPAAPAPTPAAPAAPATPEPQAQTSSEPAPKGKGKGTKGVTKKGKGKEPEAPAAAPAPRKPANVGKTPGGWAQWKAAQPADIANSPAWQKLGGTPAATPAASTPQAPAAIPADAPEPRDDDGDGFPDFGAPQSANFKVNKKGQPVDPNASPDMFAGAKKPGALSKIFGAGKKGQDTGMAMQPKKGALSKIFKKKGQEFQDNPYAMDQQPDYAAANGPDWQASGDPFAPTDPPKKGKKGAPLDKDDNLGTYQSGEDALDDLDTFLKQNPAPGGGAAAVQKLKKDVGPPAPGSSGQHAMNNLNWDLKRAKGKR